MVGREVGQSYFAWHQYSLICNFLTYIVAFGFRFLHESYRGNFKKEEETNLMTSCGT